ncbi:proline-rich protein 36-like [Palaemon carinicauda]|uniref:proline-rich protein 36-like n=1 Tax=Palaemon carinicauda TaxID=392227 RepID=UPI0035B6A09B
MSDVSQAPSHRRCRSCNRRIPKASVDPHTACSDCRDRLCLLENRCEECAGLSELDFVRLLKYSSKLERGRVRRSSSHSSMFSSPHDPLPFPTPVVATPEPTVCPPPDMSIVLRAIQALGDKVESVVSDHKSLMAEVKELKVKSAVGGNSASAVTSASVGAVPSASGASVVREDFSVRASRPPSPGPLASSHAQGRSNVEGLKGSTGLVRRTELSSVVAGVSSLDRHSHLQTIEPVFSSADQLAGKKRWSQVSRPLKRRVQSASAQPGCSHWLSSDSPQSSVDCTPPKRSKVLLKQSPTVTLPQSVIVSADPKWTLLQSMQAQLSDLMRECRAESVAPPPPPTLLPPVLAPPVLAQPAPAPPGRSTICQAYDVEPLSEFAVPSVVQPQPSLRQPLLWDQESYSTLPPPPLAAPPVVQLSVGVQQPLPSVSLSAQPSLQRAQPSSRQAPLHPGLAPQEPQLARTLPCSAQPQPLHAPLISQEQERTTPPPSSAQLVQSLGSTLARSQPPSPMRLPSASSVVQPLQSEPQVFPQQLQEEETSVIVPSRSDSAVQHSGPIASLPSADEVSDDEEAHLDPSSDVEESKLSPLSIDFRKVLALLREIYPDHFVSAIPRSPPSEFSLGVQQAKSNYTKLVLARSSKRALRILGEWLQSKQHLGKTSFMFPPTKLASKGCVWYATGEAPGLGVPASAQADFSSLVDSPRRTAMRRSKVCWTFSDLDHLLKGLFRAFEMFNFLDWCLGALSKKTSPADKDSAMLIMSCMDKAIRDGSGELASLFVSGVLKKREQLCTFLSASITPCQRSQLLFAPLSKFLFPEELVKDLSAALIQKDTHDLVASSARKSKVATSVPKTYRSPVADTPATRFIPPFRGRAPSRGSSRPDSHRSKSRKGPRTSKGKN